MPAEPSILPRRAFALSPVTPRLLRTVLAAAGLWLAAAVCGSAQAQTQIPVQAPGQATPKPGTQAAPQAVPGFWAPRRRPERPDLSRLTVIRFLTETDYPPFNFTGPDGNPAGSRVGGRIIAVSRVAQTASSSDGN